VEYLLISAPNRLTGARLRFHLEAAGLRTGETDAGLEVWCGERDWQAIVEAMAVTLSPAERRDTRVAAVRGGGQAAVHHAIFRARTVASLLEEFSRRWLDDVLADKRIAIYFQPLVQYPPGRIHGYECLMRGIETDGRLIEPGRMFDAACALEKISRLDDECRMAALRMAARYASRGLTFFVNFLPSAIHDPEACVRRMSRQLGDKLAPHQIAFEVVETDKVHDRQHLGAVLRTFRKAGFKVALDDVGAGYSSLLNLSALRPDYIKLDGELVRRAARSALEAKMVRDLAETARQNGIVTVAEGIETAAQFAFVLRSGIRLTQGMFHARPAPAPLGQAEARSVLGRARAVATGVAAA